ncbi:hypothetical protein FO519_005236 [Halicephalobus sp. NKZ332]|nr:hypothetical protein FO519_005236 [Halicephalobus sp. NKZ332]
MSTQVHFVRNNPFILNDSRFGSGDLVVREQISTNSGYPGNRQVSQSASCSNLQQRSYVGSQFEPQLPSQPQAPVPISVSRRYRLVSERSSDENPVGNQLSKQSEISNSIHSVAYYGQNPEENYDMLMSSTKKLTKHLPEDSDWNQVVQVSSQNYGTQTLPQKYSIQVGFQNQETFERRLEHSQSHGAISQVHLREPLKIDLTEKNEDSWKREGRQDVWQNNGDKSGENLYPPNVGVLPFSKRIDQVQNQPVILNVAAPGSDYFPPTHYSTLPIKRSGSVKSVKESTLQKSTPGANQIMRWIKEKKAKFKESRRTSSSTVSINSSILKPPPPQGILRTKKKDYGNFIGSLQRNTPQGRQYSAPVYPNWSNAQRTEYYDTSHVFNHDPYDDPFDDYEYYGDPGSAQYNYFQENPYLPRFQPMNPQMVQRYPPVVPEPDYSVSSESEYSYGPCNSPRVRFHFPPEEPPYENTEKNLEPPSTKKLEKIYQKIKPAVQNLISSKKTQKEENPSISSTLSNDETDSTGSGTINVPKKIIEDKDNKANEKDEKESEEQSQGNVFFFGETRIDYNCQRVGDNVVVHYTSRKVTSKDGKVASKIQRRGVITDMEYGPGIVQKLREKFSKMASTAIETAQISPHAKQKKFPSVDDILSEGDRRNSSLERKIELHDPNHNHQPKFTNIHRKYSEDIEAEFADSIGINLTSRNIPFKQEKPLPQHHLSQQHIPQQNIQEYYQEKFLPQHHLSQQHVPENHLQQQYLQEKYIPQHHLSEQHLHQEQHQQSSMYSGHHQQGLEEPRSVVEASPIPPISALRAKFEKQALQGSNSNFYSRPSYSQRSHSVQPTVRKSASEDDIIDDRRFSQRLPPKIPENKPTGVLREPIPIEKERELAKLSEKEKEWIRISERDRGLMKLREGELMKADEQEKNRLMRIMDLVSPPADPGPKEFMHHQLQSPELPSPTASTASSDRSPPPEEPRLQFEEQESEVRYRRDQDYEDRINFRTQTLRDERLNEKNVFNAQKQKITLTLPIGEKLPVGENYPLKSSSTSDIRVGKPGNTPVTGPGKLKISNDDSGISEVQLLLSRFTVMREQKMQDSLQTDAIKETLTQLEEAQKEEKHLPTAIVPPVQQPPKPPVIPQIQQQQIKSSVVTPVQQHHQQIKSSVVTPIQQQPKPALVPKPQTNWQPLQQQKNIVNITISKGESGWFIS